MALSDKVRFLGFSVVNGTIAIARKALQTAMDKVKALTPREVPINLWNRPWTRSIYGMWAGRIIIV